MYSLEDFKKVWKDTKKDNILTQFYFEHLDLIMYKKMWETAKEEFAKYPEPEELTIMEQIEDMYFKKEDVIEDLIKEVCK